MPFRYTEQLFTEMLADTLKKPVRLVGFRPTKTAQTMYSVRTD